MTEHRTMRLGAALPFGDLEGGPLRAGSLSRSAATIERLGYSSVWTFDVIGRGFMNSDPLMALAVAAGVTENVELATGILQLPLRNVAEVAHRLFTLETLAPGRVLFGVGPGSTEGDFDVFERDYASRFKQFEAQWTELQRWVADGRVDDRDLQPPESALGGPTLMLAGWKGRWVERAAVEAPVWVASALHTDDAQLAENISRYREAGGKRAIAGSVMIAEDPAETIERLGYLASLGFDDAAVFDLKASEERFAAVRNGVPQ